MKLYLNPLNSILIIIGFIVVSFTMLSCKSTSKTKLEVGVTDAFYYKSFGGQGRSRHLNFELYIEQNQELSDEEYWLDFKSVKLKLKKHNQNGNVVLKGQHTEYKTGRDKPWPQENNLFDKIPFNEVSLNIINKNKTKRIQIKEFKTKQPVYYP